MGRHGMRQRVHVLLRAVGGEDSPFGDFEEEGDKYAYNSLVSLEAQIDTALATLTERERHAMRLRFGLDDGRAKTLKEAGLTMGLSAERVRQLEAAALRKLREPDRLALLPRALH